MSRIGAILFRGRARRPLFLAIAVVLAPMATSASAQYGVRDDIVKVPTSFVFASSFNPLPIPFFGNGQSGSVATINVIGPDGVARLAQMHDFDDIHPFNTTFDSVRSDENVGSGSTQVLNIVWLGNSRRDMGGKKTGYKLPQPAEPLRMRDWQNSGMEGGTFESRTAQDDIAVPISDEAPIDEVEESNAFGLAYGLGTLGTEQQFRFRLYGSILGDSYWAADVENQIFGPKAGLVWRSRRGPWSFDLQSLILLGFNSGQVDQSSALGQDFIPGTLNHLLYMRPT
jgi:hypothetical protein